MGGDVRVGSVEGQRAPTSAKRRDASIAILQVHEPESASQSSSSEFGLATFILAILLARFCLRMSLVVKSLQGEHRTRGIVGVGNPSAQGGPGPPQYLSGYEANRYDPNRYDPARIASNPSQVTSRYSTNPAYPQNIYPQNTYPQNTSAQYPAGIASGSSSSSSSTPPVVWPSGYQPNGYQPSGSNYYRR